MTLAQILREKIPRRGILGAMMFLACMFSYFIRTNLSIIIVAMVKNGTDTREENGTDTREENGTRTDDFGERYEWNEIVQGAVLMAYYCGVVPASIPAGILAEKFGGSKVVALATLIPALLNLLMPWASSVHYMFAIVLRFLMGFFGSAVYPALHAMIARWVPPNEKGMFVWAMQGGPFGTVVTFVLCSQVIDTYGWVAAYYVTSGLILVFFALWVYLIHDTPDQHPSITEREKEYIKKQIGTSVSKQKVKLPVVAVITSLPFLVLLWAHFANMWGIYFISTNGPKYTLQVLGFNMKSGGFMTGLPYIARLGAGVLFAAAGDYLLRTKYLTVVWLRKIFMIPSHMGPALCLLGMTYAGKDKFWGISMMILALAFNGAACQTSLQNHQDLSPNFAGSLYGVMNTIGSFPGFIIPAVVGVLTNEHNSVETWRPMFWISAIVFMSATVLFWLFGSANIQPWNDISNGGVEGAISTIPDEEMKMTMDTKKAQVMSDDEEEENARI
ncbi:putative inorganic phosphate cotransporter isoform X1 [Neodiprion lecontei]|uniref:Inorganic phosphate cotransporter isoform X1 n=1 Tax=Neodiprion lecontei TaxID=441921 RepID=A0A6J0BPD9_NEOLC|nr:putative inorganic phosphate cotransporter isoform X1 [Neodiprion lecontei]